MGGDALCAAVGAAARERYIAGGGDERTHLDVPCLAGLGYLCKVHIGRRRVLDGGAVVGGEVLVLTVDYLISVSRGGCIPLNSYAAVAVVDKVHRHRLRRYGKGYLRAAGIPSDAGNCHRGLAGLGVPGQRKSVIHVSDKNSLPVGDGKLLLAGNNRLSAVLVQRLRQRDAAPVDALCAVGDLAGSSVICRRKDAGAGKPLSGCHNSSRSE